MYSIFHEVQWNDPPHRRPMKQLKTRSDSYETFAVLDGSWMWRKFVQLTRHFWVPISRLFISDVNKDLDFKAKAKAKAKDLEFKAKTKAKDLSFKAKAKAKDLCFKAKAKAKDLSFKAKAKAKDLPFYQGQGHKFGP